MSHKRYIVELSSEERTRLRRLTATGSPKAQARRRARIWLLCDQGPEGPAWTDERTAEAVGVTEMTVSRARRALVEEGLEAALQRKPRPPRPRKAGRNGRGRAGPAGLLDAAARPRALDPEAAGGRAGGPGGGRCNRARDGAPHAQKNALKPWRKQCWCIPPQANAAFVHNMEDVLAVYQRPPDDRCPVVCVDETSKQLVSETRVPQPAARGQPVRYDYEYRRHGVCNLFMLTAPQQGWRTVKVTARRTKLDFAAVLRDLTDVHFPQAEKVVLVCDNLNTHHPSVLYEAFPPAEARRIAARLEWHYTPKHGSWLNLAEIEFAALAAQCLDRRIAGEAVLRAAIAAWVRERNALGTPVHWQFTTEDARIKLLHLYPTFE